MKRKFLNKKTILLGSIALVTVLLAAGCILLFSLLNIASIIFFWRPSRLISPVPPEIYPVPWDFLTRM